MYGTILVAVGAGSDAVLRHAAAIAAGTGDTVQVLHIRAIDTTEPTSTGVTPAAVTVVEEDAGEARDVVAGAVRTLAEAGVSARGEVTEAMRHDVARAVLARAEELSAGLIVVGMHQRGFLAGLLGNIGDQVAHHADCPVLLVP